MRQFFILDSADPRVLWALFRRPLLLQVVEEGAGLNGMSSEGGQHARGAALLEVKVFVNWYHDRCFADPADIAPDDVDDRVRLRDSIRRHDAWEVVRELSVRVIVWADLSR